ncbi:MAG: oxalyl-CoA decarboxylase [Chloroflexi bacterium]|nr:oxalyl-CoA decarboxylase [Chloroflexota bacterium]MDA1146254.1 oxalyl-CoA decarboxylase [Chloroflexota bacterium]
MTTQTSPATTDKTNGAGETILGGVLLARSLKQQGVDYMFGVVGFPVSELAGYAQDEGIKYVGMRNEQAASYAAQAASYILGRPQVCIVVSGPGVIHGLAGLANAKSNCWPMILIGGASAISQNGMGAFQEENQVEIARLVSKYAHSLDRADRIPYYVEQAVRTSIYGRPGPAYLDAPDDVLTAEIPISSVKTMPTVPNPPKPGVPERDIQAALAALKSAERPLVIIGKGMAWARAENEVLELIEKTQLPFLPTPMGKGVIDDDHPLAISPARTLALREADVVLLLGARLNWILHFGKPPRWAEDVRIIQVDIAAEEIGANVPAEVGLVGDGAAIVAQLNQAIDADGWQYPGETTWRSQLQQKVDENVQISEQLMADDSSPLNYYRVLKEVRDTLPADTVIVSEGANTMDIGRTVLPNKGARTRLDAGTYGTMGVGLGFAIGAAVAKPGTRIVAVEGDAAFGFSGMEYETMVRHNLPITIVVINNNGIGGGIAELPVDRDPPPGVYSPEARYERIADMFGGRSYYVTEAHELEPALSAANTGEGPAIVHIRIDPRAGRKPQQFGWHTPTN